MSKISETFARLKDKNEGALIAYLTVGDPHPKKTPRLIEALIKGGADIVELGVPFSDPIADGPTIQNAVTRSLSSGAKPSDAFEVARTINERFDVPLVLMTYFNPVIQFGLPKFLDLATKSGLAGMIVPDLPVEESRDYRKQCVAHNIDTIFLASPSTTRERLRRILTETSGFLYLISLYGVTGARPKLDETALRLVKEYHDFVAGSVRLAAGFGVSKPEHVVQLIDAGADGAIVGSAFIKIIEQNQRNTREAARKLERFAQALKKATARTRMGTRA